MTRLYTLLSRASTGIVVLVWAALLVAVATVVVVLTGTVIERYDIVRIGFVAAGLALFRAVWVSWCCHGAEIAANNARIEQETARIERLKEIQAARETAAFALQNARTAAEYRAVREQLALLDAQWADACGNRRPATGQTTRLKPYHLPSQEDEP